MSTNDPAGFEEQHDGCFALADAVTLLLVSANVKDEHFTAGLHVALREGATVERAKDALAHTRCLDMGSACNAPTHLADDNGLTLGVAARHVIDSARTGTLGTRPTTA